MKTDGDWLVNYSESREKRCRHPLICKARKEGRSNLESIREPIRREERPKELSGVSDDAESGREGRIEAVGRQR